MSMLRRDAVFALILGSALVSALSHACGAETPGAIRALTSTAFAAPTAPPNLSTRVSDFLSHPQAGSLGDRLREPSALARFYARRDGQPAWTDAPEAYASLLRALRVADTHGLRPDDYHLDLLAADDGTADVYTSLQRDLLLSDAFLHLARALSAGAVDPRELDPNHARGEVPPDPVEALEAALARGDPATVLASLAPSHPEYERLRAGLARLRDEPREAACPEFPDGPLLRPGDRDSRVTRLRACLGTSSSMTRERVADPARLDADLAERLRVFQSGRGLAPDGVLGPETTAALVATRAQRIDRVRVNLERWRWQPRDFGRRFVRVDVPRYRLRAFEDGKTEPTLSMRVVVGRPSWSTPVIHTEIDRLLLNPAWEVPRSIFLKEILPAARLDPGYFEAEGLELMERRDGVWHKLDPTSVDWSRVGPERAPFHVRQPPGPRNPLGRIEFLSDNPYAIYLHGTPRRDALRQPVRVLSHGCVRVEDELALARFALAPDPTWTAERLADMLQKETRKRVVLPEPLPLHIVYLTVEADAKGMLSFIPDPYDWDPPLLALLGREDPVSGVGE